MVPLLNRPQTPPSEPASVGLKHPQVTDKPLTQLCTYRENIAVPDLQLRRVTHYGTVKFGEIACEAVVLNDGTRGFVQRQFAQLLGYNPKNPGNRFREFLANFAPNALSVKEKTEVSKVLMPHGGHAGFISADVVTDMVTGVIDAAVNGTIHKQQRFAVAPCLKIQASMAKVGMNALIDEATGYQYQRAPDALQALLSKLLRQQAATWERRFHPDFYHAIYRLFGWKYAGHDQNPPSIVGQITYDWVYAPVMPLAMIEELRSRKALSDKHHQWLSADGLQLLEYQIRAVTVIARCSRDYKDFRNRCNAVFDGALQLDLFDESQAA